MVAAVGERAIGQVGLHQSPNPRLAHSARIGLMVHPEYWGRGVGTALTRAALELADNWLNLRRVELDVFTHNSAAIRLYRNLGFEVEGTRRRVVFGDGRWLDEYEMARLRGMEHEHASPAAALDSNRASPLQDSALKRLIVRPPKLEDAAALYALWRQPAICRTTLQLPSQEISRTEERLKDRNPALHRFLAELDGSAIGMISLRQSQLPRLAHSADLGMAVGEQYWGMGVGSALMKAALDLADNWLNLSRVSLDVNTDNAAAVRLYLKFGFEFEGTRRFHTYGDGRWADSYFMARLRD
jgi:putative acetyltransferase